MFRNIVFDFGQVLVRFDPAAMVAQDVKDEADRALVTNVLFDRKLWDRLDAGTITDEEVLAAARAALPARLHAAAERIYRDWPYRLPEIEGMRALLRDLKARGKRVFVLSNISKYFAAHTDGSPILAETDGCVFSSLCGFVKPDPAIFAYICEKHGLLPRETVFVDDNAANVAGGRAFGLQTYLFDGDAAHLRETLFAGL